MVIAALRLYFTSQQMFSKELFNQFKMEPSNEKQKAVLTPEEYSKFLVLLKKNKKSQLKTIIQLINHSGMRISSVINLKVKDVNFSKGW